MTITLYHIENVIKYMKMIFWQLLKQNLSIMHFENLINQNTLNKSQISQMMNSQHNVDMPCKYVILQLENIILLHDHVTQLTNQFCYSTVSRK